MKRPSRRKLSNIFRNVINAKDKSYIGLHTNWKTSKYNIGYLNRIYGPVGLVGDIYSSLESLKKKKIHFCGNGIDLEKSRKCASPSLLIMRSDMKTRNFGNIIYYCSESSDLEFERNSLSENRRDKIPIRVLLELKSSKKCFLYAGLFWVTVIYRKSNDKLFIFKLIKMGGQEESRKRKRDSICSLIETFPPKKKKKIKVEKTNKNEVRIAEKLRVEKENMMEIQKKYKEQLKKQESALEKYRKGFTPEELNKFSRMSFDYQNQTIGRINGLKENSVHLFDLGKEQKFKFMY